MFPSDIFSPDQDVVKEAGSCGDLNKGPFDVSGNEAYWLNQTGNSLNVRISTAAKRNNLNYIGGIANRFASHDYCSSESWFRSRTESFSIQGDQNGTIHPNLAGHQAIAEEIVSNLYFGPEPEPIRFLKITFTRFRLFDELAEPQGAKQSLGIAVNCLKRDYQIAAPGEFITLGEWIELPESQFEYGTAIFPLSSPPRLPKELQINAFTTFPPIIRQSNPLDNGHSFEVVESERIVTLNRRIDSADNYGIGPARIEKSNTIRNAYFDLEYVVEQRFGIEDLINPADTVYTPGEEQTDQFLDRFQDLEVSLAPIISVGTDPASGQPVINLVPISGAYDLWVSDDYVTWNLPEQEEFEFSSQAGTVKLIDHGTTSEEPRYYRLLRTDQPPEVVVLEDRDLFLSLSNGLKATDAYPDIGRLAGGSSAILVSGMVTIINRAFALFSGNADDDEWTDRLPGPDIAITGKEDIDLLFSTEVYAAGFDFVEPENDPHVDSTFIDSVFEIKLYSGDLEISSHMWEPPNDIATFFGVLSDAPFDRISITEVVGSIENEFFGQVYVGLFANNRNLQTPDLTNFRPALRLDGEEIVIEFDSNSADVYMMLESKTLLTGSWNNTGYFKPGTGDRLEVRRAKDESAKSEFFQIIPNRVAAYRLQ